MRRGAAQRVIPGPVEARRIARIAVEHRTQQEIGAAAVLRPRAAKREHERKRGEQRRRAERNYGPWAATARQLVFPTFPAGALSTIPAHREILSDQKLEPMLLPCLSLCRKALHRPQAFG